MNTTALSLEEFAKIWLDEHKIDPENFFEGELEKSIIEAFKNIEKAFSKSSNNTFHFKLKVLARIIKVYLDGYQ